MTTKVGMSKKSNDPEFDEYNRHFTAMEAAAESLLKDSKTFSEAVAALLTSGHQFSVHFSNIFHPTSNEYNLDSKHPDAANTIRNVDQYQTEMEELRMSLTPELELIESRIIGPVKELQGVLKLIRKNITKRDHKLVDYDRYNNSLVKLREKKEKTLADEKNLFKLEQDFEQASSEYEMFNNALKTDLPRFMQLAAQFIDPLFHSFYYMQLNIFYLMLEKLNYFCEKKYDTSGTTQDIVNAYEQRRGDAREQVEGLSIAKRYVSTARSLQASRAGSGGLSPGGGLSRATSAASTLRTSPTSYTPPSRANTVSSAASKFGSLASKKAPPPPPGASLSANAAAPPPPYSPANAGAAPSMARSAPKMKHPQLYTIMFDECIQEGLVTILGMQDLVATNEQHDRAKIDERRQALMTWAKSAQTTIAGILEKDREDFLAQLEARMKELSEATLHIETRPEIAKDIDEAKATHVGPSVAVLGARNRRKEQAWDDWD
ncbi:hypothetical protein FRB90_002348 [Tulasnella sp. 427]|nr:hypothetical protein FRB90_002348 [Tulasnella sp. 427]